MNDIHRMGRILPFPKIKIAFISAIFTVVIVAAGAKTKAQEIKAVDVTAKGIQIGQQVPDITITNLHNYKDKNGKLATTAKLSDFKGKLLILDFWATWCSPCVAMIPKMDSLQKSFGDKVQFLSVTYQSEKDALSFIEKFEEQQKKKFNLPMVTDSKELHKLFPHTTLPHYVWIDGNSIVKAITEAKNVNKETIIKMFSGNGDIEKKSEFRIAYDSKKPFLLNGNGGDGSNMLYHSILTKYIEGISPSYSRTPLNNNSQGKVISRNTSLLQIFRIAYGGYDKYYSPSRVVLNVADKSLLYSEKEGMEYMNWLRSGNGYCYELIVPPNLSRGMFQIMKNDLSNFFPQYIAKAEKRKVKCLVLKRTSSIDKLKTNGGHSSIEFSALGFEMKNSLLSAMIIRMEVQFMQGSTYPIVDGTNYKSAVDLKIEGKLSDLSDLNDKLSKYDLKFEVEDYITDVLIIEDRQKLDD